MSDRIEGTKLTGPIRQWAAHGTLGRTATVTVAALATTVCETHTITDAAARVGDVISVSPGATPEAGWTISSAWVSAAGTIKVATVNAAAATLTGGSLALVYTINR